MVLMSVAAMWVPPANQAAASSQASMDAINANTNSYDFWSIAVLVDDDIPNDNMPAQVSDGQAWATQHSIDHPVWVGDVPAALGSEWGIVALPTYVIADPNLRVRQIIEGYPGDSVLAQAVDSAFSAFMNENPGWQRPCP